MLKKKTTIRELWNGHWWVWICLDNEPIIFQREDALSQLMEWSLETAKAHENQNSGTVDQQEHPTSSQTR